MRSGLWPLVEEGGRFQPNGGKGIYDLGIYDLRGRGVSVLLRWVGLNGEDWCGRRGTTALPS